MNAKENAKERRLDVKVADPPSASASDSAVAAYSPSPSGSGSASEATKTMKAAKRTKMVVLNMTIVGWWLENEKKNVQETDFFL